MSQIRKLELFFKELIASFSNHQSSKQGKSSEYFLNSRSRLISKLVRL